VALFILLDNSVINEKSQILHDVLSIHNTELAETNHVVSQQMCF
jgi:hypothetical protein